MPDFLRKHLPHDIPIWIDPSQEAFFITINCRHRNQNFLANPHVWNGLVESIEHREAKLEWKWNLLLAMPDHLHGIVRFPDRFFMRKSITNWKRWIATKYQVQWQDGFFDHRLRSVECAQEKAKYIRQNPVRAGLANNPADWPYLREPRR